MANQTFNSNGHDEIECPHCGQTMQNLSDLEPSDRAMTSTECEHCEKPVQIGVSTTTIYTALAVAS